MSHEPPAGGRPDWYTPPEVFARLGLEFDLDPCAPQWPRAHWIPAKRRIELPDDGFTAEWEGRVWLNPPYGRDETGRWLGRLADHGNGIALVFVRSDTPWWQFTHARADLVCFPLGRINFIWGGGTPEEKRGRRHGDPGRAGHASCMFAFGDECAIALHRSGLGECSRPVAAGVSALWS